MTIGTATYRIDPKDNSLQVSIEEKGVRYYSDYAAPLNGLAPWEKYLNLSSPTSTLSLPSPQEVFSKRADEALQKLLKDEAKLKTLATEGTVEIDRVVFKLDNGVAKQNNSNILYTNDYFDSSLNGGYAFDSDVYKGQYGQAPWIKYLSTPTITESQGDDLLTVQRMFEALTNEKNPDFPGYMKKLASGETVDLLNVKFSLSPKDYNVLLANYNGREYRYRIEETSKWMKYITPTQTPDQSPKDQHSSNLLIDFWNATIDLGANLFDLILP